MKKIIWLILIVVILVVSIVGFVFIRSKFDRVCKIGNYDISLNVPNAYMEMKKSEENILLNLYNNAAGITISGFELNNNFWSSGDTMARANEYIELMSSVNYDSSMQNIKKEILSETEDKIARIEFELSRPNDDSKVIAFIANEEIGDVVIEIFGTIDNMENNKEEIEQITKSLKIK